MEGAAAQAQENLSRGQSLIPSISKSTQWWTEDEVNLLAAVISAESRGEPYEGQLAVGCVILNRLDTGWEDNIHDVVYAPGQFASPHWEYSETALQAARECLQGNRIFPEGVVFFQQKKLSVWFDADWYCTIGHHNFYIKEGD